MAVQDPVIGVPEITAIDLVDDYPPKADEISTMVCNNEYDQIIIGVDDRHGLLPCIKLVRRLVTKHLNPRYRGRVWGRRQPGAQS